MQQDDCRVPLLLLPMLPLMLVHVFPCPYLEEAVRNDVLRQ